MVVALPVRRTHERHPDEIRPTSGPVADLDRLHRQLAEYLESWRLPSLLGDAFTPLADVEETADAFQVEVELPGVNKDDLDIEVAGRRLTVTGVRKERERVGILRKRERTVGRFRHEVILPEEVGDAPVEADLDQGVLTIKVAKPASHRARRIAVH